MKRAMRLAASTLFLMMVVALLSPTVGVATPLEPPVADEGFGVVTSPLLSEEQRRAELEGASSWAWDEGGEPGDVELQAGATFYDRESAASYLADQLVARRTPFSFSLSATTSDASALFRDVLERAMSEGSGSGVRGDYLRGHYRTIKWHWSSLESMHTFTVDVVYYTTAAQEAQTTSAVNSVLDQIGARNASDYDAVVRIHDWIVTHVDYDNEHVADDNYFPQFSAYGAVVNRKAVCQGMSLLFYRMCHEVGVDCRYISGMGFRAGGGGPHGWNIVKLGQYWYNLDITWEDNVRGSSTHNWFLRSQANFPGHDRDDEYDTAAFHAAYPMGPKNYDPADVPTISIAGATVSGVSPRYRFTGYAIAPVVSVSLNGKILSRSSDYTVAYENNVSPGTARVVVSGRGGYSGSVRVSYEIYWTSECRYFVDTPPSAWYVKSGVIDYVTDEGIMTGYRNGSVLSGYFGPENPVTRGQVALMLYRMAGEPETDGAARFSDVDYSQYYGDAINWARSTGIISGYGSTNRFGPDDPVTREQLSKMLAGYASTGFGIDVSSDCSAASRIQGWASVSAYARGYVGWAVDEGIIGGMVQQDGTQLAPQAVATRSQAAKMLMVLDRDVVGDAPPVTRPPEVPDEGSADGFDYAVYSGAEGYKEGDTLSLAGIDSDLRYWGPGVYLFNYEGEGGRVKIPAEVGGRPVRAVDLSYSGVESLDVTECSELSQLDVMSNQLIELDVSHCPDLRVLVASSNELASLDVTGCTKLVELACRFNSLEEMDVSGCRALGYLDLDGNNLSELDVRSCTQLTTLSVAQNRIRELDVSRCPGLTYLGCEYNLLTSLDVSSAPNLSFLYCQGNLIEDTEGLEAWLSGDGHEGQVLPQG